MMAVWGSNTLTPCSEAGTASPWRMRRVVWVTTGCTHGTNRYSVVASFRPRGVPCAARTVPTRSACLTIVVVMVSRRRFRGPHPFLHLGPALPRCLHDPLHLACGAPRAIPHGAARQDGRRLKRPLGVGYRPAEHPHAIVQQGAVGGMMDMR